MRLAALLALLSCSLAKVPSLEPLSDDELRQYSQWPMHQHLQPEWDRGEVQQADNPDVAAARKTSEQLQKAAQQHQEGEVDQAVQVLKQVLKDNPNNAEAYASLSKALNDLGKFDLADKAMAKATRLRNEALSAWSLF